MRDINYISEGVIFLRTSPGRFFDVNKALIKSHLVGCNFPLPRISFVTLNHEYNFTSPSRSVEYISYIQYPNTLFFSWKFSWQLLALGTPSQYQYGWIRMPFQFDQMTTYLSPPFLCYMLDCSWCRHMTSYSIKAVNTLIQRWSILI